MAITHTHKFENAAAARDFILAGNAYLTLVSDKSKTRYTYRIKKSNERTLFFVSVLYGDNTKEYTYIGLIREKTFELARKASPDDPRVKAFAWTWAFLKREDRVPTTLEVWHEGRCGVCGRKLTVPSSIAIGVGPDCQTKPTYQHSQRPGKIIY